MKHNALLSSIAIGILFMSSIFLQCATAQADSGNPQLRTWLRENKVIPRLVKLDRTWLLQIEGEEALLQADARGSMQVIAQTDGIALYLCYLKRITEFLLGVPTCTVPLCYVDKVLNLLIALQVCTAAAAT